MRDSDGGVLAVEVRIAVVMMKVDDALAWLKKKGDGDEEDEADGGEEYGGCIRGAGFSGSQKREGGERRLTRVLRRSRDRHMPLGGF